MGIAIAERTALENLVGMQSVPLDGKRMSIEGLYLLFNEILAGGRDKRPVEVYESMPGKGLMFLGSLYYQPTEASQMTMGYIFFFTPHRSQLEEGGLNNITLSRFAFKTLAVSENGFCIKQRSMEGQYTLAIILPDDLAMDRAKEMKNVMKRLYG